MMGCDLMNVFILLAMVFMHIVDDYYLQGILANLKQKVWWEKNAPKELYKNDYIVALFMHSFSWAFMIMLPVAVFLNFSLTPMFCLLFGINVATHAIVDDLKANKLKINLITDQSIHLVQIIVTFLILVV